MASPITISARALIQELMTWPSIDEPILVLSADRRDLTHFDNPEPIVGFAQRGRAQIVLLYGHNDPDPGRIRRLRYGQ